MSKLLGLVMAVILLGTAPSMAATVCDKAKKGTYLSNVCWLFEDFHALNWRIVSVNRGDCTISLEDEVRERVPAVRNPHPDDPSHWRHEKRTTRFTVFLRRANLRESNFWTLGKVTTCVSLIGEGITDHAIREDFRDGINLCGNKSEDRVTRAVTNLYARYCKGKASEF